METEKPSAKNNEQAFLPSVQAVLKTIIFGLYSTVEPQILDSAKIRTQRCPILGHRSRNLYVQNPN